mgnify:CR=1 FL=1
MLRYAAMESSLLHRSQPEPVQERGQKTRQKVLLAACKVLARRGFSEARVDEITKVARVGYGTFYKYFHNKQDVLEAVVEEIYAQLTEAAFPTQVLASQLEDQIRTGITNYLKVYQKNREVLLALRPASQMNPWIRKLLSDLRERDVQWMAGELKKLRDQGWNIQGNLEVFSLALLQMVDTAAQDWISHRQHVRLEEIAGTLCDIWFKAILPSRPGLASPPCP